MIVNSRTSLPRMAMEHMRVTCGPTGARTHTVSPVGPLPSRFGSGAGVRGKAQLVVVLREGVSSWANQKPRTRRGQRVPRNVCSIDEQLFRSPNSAAWSRLYGLISQRSTSRSACTSRSATRYRSSMANDAFPRVRSWWSISKCLSEFCFPHWSVDPQINLKVISSNLICTTNSAERRAA